MLIKTKTAFGMLKTSPGETLHFFYCDEGKEDGKPVLLFDKRPVGKDEQGNVADPAKKKGRCIGRMTIAGDGTLNVIPKGSAPSTLKSDVEAIGRPHGVTAVEIGAPEPEDGAAPVAPETPPAQKSGPPSAKPAPSADPKAAAVAAKAKSLVKGLQYALTNEPDEKLRLLQALETRLTAEIAQAEKDGVSPTDLAKIAASVRDHIASTISGTTAEIEAELKKRAAELIALGRGRIAVPANEPPANVKARAAALHNAIIEIEESAESMRGMAMRMKLGAVVAKIGALERGLAPLRAEYESLFPKRATKGDPTPKKVVEVSGKLDLGTETEQVVLGNLRTALLGRFKKSWPDVKKALKSDEKAMGQMWAYRKKVNDRICGVIKDKYTHRNGAVKVRIVGSMTLESDIDVGIDGHGYDARTGEMVPDYAIVKELNDMYKAEFGAQPGTLFDINFYANAPNPKKEPDEMSPVERDMTAMAEAGQDVGALMKMRRYMTWEAYDKYMKDVLDGVKADKELHDATKRQFEEADSLYFLALVKLLEEAKIPVPTGTGPKAQKAILAAVDKLEEDPEALMEANNEIYVKEMKEVRDLEKLAAGQEGDALAATLAKIRTLMSNSIFFANEAYHSEGTFKHIVGAGQTVANEADNMEEFKEKPGETEKAKKEREAAKKKHVDQKTNEALGELSPSEFLQSFNEQLGDLLKDLKHYAHDPYPGLGFYRCSKYMERMCDAVFWIGKTDANVAALKIAGYDPIALKGKITSTLVATRKGAVKFTGDDGQELADDDVEREAYAIEQVGKLFPGVRTLPQLGAIFTGLGTEVNSILRKADVGRKMKAKDEKAYFEAGKKK